MSHQLLARTCAWCRGEIPSTARADSICCSVRCRQARHRFTTGVGVAPAASPVDALRLAYADPPYPGTATKYYADHPDYGGEVDHPALIASLAADYDGWALSTSAAALPAVLASCPPGVRVAAWHRWERPNAAARGVQNAWEPVVFSGGRYGRRPGGAPRRVDSLVYRPGVRTTDPHRVIGAKPATFWRWIFDLLGALPGDQFTDVFPGSGGGARAWDAFTRPVDATRADGAA